MRHHPDKARNSRLTVTLPRHRNCKDLIDEQLTSNIRRTVYKKSPSPAFRNASKGRFKASRYGIHLYIFDTQDLDMIDLATWNLSIPEGSPAMTIETPRLVQGFKDQYFNAETGTVFFWAPVTGTRTANAIYPRSELRETYPDGTLRNWLYPAADNTLRATVTVNHCLLYTSPSPRDCS